MKIQALILLGLAFFWSGQNVLAKYLDDETDLVYYGFRYYNPTHGKWLIRDQLGEYGGKNLYGFVGNQPTRRVDLLGHVALSFIDIRRPKGLKDGKFTAWVVQWTVPPDTPVGYVIQEMDWKFTDVHTCDGSNWDDNTIWGKLNNQGDVRFHWWEAWRNSEQDGKFNHENAFVDTWALDPNSHFYRDGLTDGMLTMRGNAAFYEKTTQSSDEQSDLQANFGVAWEQGTHANPSGPGTPMSGGLFSTINHPTLLNVDPGDQVVRTEVVTWHPCPSGCDVPDRSTKVEAVAEGHQPENK